MEIEALGVFADEVTDGWAEDVLTACVVRTGGTVDTIGKMSKNRTGRQCRMEQNSRKGTRKGVRYEVSG